MGKGARRRAWRAWWSLWNELRDRAADWDEEERLPAVPALEEAAKRRGVNLKMLVRRMREMLSNLDDASLARAAAEDASIVHDLERQSDLVDAVLAELENGGPEGLRDRAYFAVDGWEIDEPIEDERPDEADVATDQLVE